MLYLFLLAFSFLNADLPTVEKVDLSRYMGKWYEIARLPFWFEERCEGQPTAEYTLKSDNTVRVHNVCHNRSGKLEEAIGEAWSVDPSNSKLKVSFIPIPGLKSLFSGDYWIIKLSDDYSWAVVSEPNQEYLWILSRTPQMDESLYNQLVKELDKLGFKTSLLIKS